MSNTNNASGASNPDVSPAPAAANAGVSPEEVAELKATIANLEKQVKFAVTKLTKGAPTPAEQNPAADPDPNPAPRQSAADKEIAKRLEVLEREREEARRERVAAALETQASKLNIDPEWLEDFKAHVERSYGKQISFDDATKTVVFRASEYDAPKAFSQWFSEMAQAGKFNRYKAGKPTPQAGPSKNAGGKASSGKEQVSLQEFIRRQRDREGKQNLDVEII